MPVLVLPVVAAVADGSSSTGFDTAVQNANALLSGLAPAS